MMFIYTSMIELLSTLVLNDELAKLNKYHTSKTCTSVSMMLM